MLKINVINYISIKWKKENMKLYMHFYAFTDNSLFIQIVKFLFLSINKYI